jgi:arylsulfatase A-like enzyme
MDGRKMGCMGDAAMASATPNMDGIADRGVLFTNAYSTCPVCNPSRASMWTGQYPHAYDCWNNHEGLRPGIPTFRTALESAGYATNAVGPLDYAYGLHSIRDQVGSWTRAANILRPLCRTPLPVIRQDEVNARDWQHTYSAVRWLREQAGSSQPFFLYLTTGLVHPAFVAEQRHLAVVDEKAVEIPPTVGDLDDAQHPVDRYIRVTKNCDQPLDEGLVHTIRHCYYGMIAALDEMVGRVLQTLADLGIRDSTYVIFSGDHGEMAGEQNQVLKRTMYEPSIHIPLIISGPDVRRGAAVPEPVSLIDIFPTLMDMGNVDYAGLAERPAGAAAPAEGGSLPHRRPGIPENPADTRVPTRMHGESLMPQLTGSTPRTRPWAFAEYNGDRCNTGVYMLRDQRYKYVHHEGYEPQLFDLDNDPWEETNCVAEHPDVASRMESVLQDGVGGETPVEIDGRAKEYDRRSYIAWRRSLPSEARYRQTMSHVYSGFDRQCIEDLVPWRDEDEAKIAAWLGTDFAQVERS